ncbi:MAG TPA: menaquinone biosynthesis protein [Flavitalea sp.]|nr:menaquinone biosynthesis protein [Flavitalea sp.]
MGKIKTGFVNYLNTKPLLYGIEHSPVNELIEPTMGYPAAIASLLEENKLDLGLIPVTVIPRLSNASIISDYCIGCNGAVASVCIFSEVPIEQVEVVMMDYQSRTSVQLAKILLRQYWKSKAEFKQATPDFRDSIKGPIAGLVIGDRAFEQRKISPYIYDLGEAWKKFTGLPFVFAAWVSNKPLDKQFILQFNNANGNGIEKIQEVVEKFPFALFDLEYYYRHCISYQLDDEKQKGLELFLEMASVVVA